MKILSNHIGKLLLYLILLGVIGTGCNTTKSAEGDHLYKGVKWEIREGKINKDIRTDMAKVARPKPNSSFLGIPFKLILFNMLPEPKKQKGLLYKMNTNGENNPYYLAR